jgi:hypothetical protein
MVSPVGSPQVGGKQREASIEIKAEVQDHSYLVVKAKGQ